MKDEDIMTWRIISISFIILCLLSGKVYFDTGDRNGIINPVECTLLMIVLFSALCSVIGVWTVIDHIEKKEEEIYKNVKKNNITNEELNELNNMIKENKKLLLELSK